MRKSLLKALRRDKKAEDEATSTADGTVALGVDRTPLPQEPDLYSTEGVTGIKVVAEPDDANLEYV